MTLSTLFILYHIWETGSFLSAPIEQTHMTHAHTVQGQTSKVAACDTRPLDTQTLDRGGVFFSFFLSPNLIPVITTHKTCFLNSIQNQQNIFNQNPYLSVFIQISSTY